MIDFDAKTLPMDFLNDFRLRAETPPAGQQALPFVALWEGFVPITTPTPLAVPIVSIDRLYGGRSTFRLGPWFGEYLRWFVWGAIQLRRGGAGMSRPRVRIPIGIARDA